MTRAHGFERSPLRVLRVTRGHAVPVRRQIAAGLASAILDGYLPPGQSLPSTRELARRLEVHRNTVAAAYRSLRDGGLVTLASGSPARVAAPNPGPGHLPRASDPPHAVGRTGPSPAPRELVAHRPVTADLLRELVNGAWESGVRRADLIAHLVEWWGRGEPIRPLLIEPDPGLRAVLGAELRARASRSLVASDGRAIGARPGLRSHVGPGTIVVARSRIAPQVAAQLPHVSEIFGLELVGGSAALARAMQIRLPGVVAVLTRSDKIRRFARTLAAGHHAAGLSVATPDPTDCGALRRATRIARLILTDASCRNTALETRAPVRELHVVSDESARRLRRYLSGHITDQMSDRMSEAR